MKNKIREIENKVDMSPEDIRYLIELAEKWATVQEIFTDPDKSIDESLSYLSNNT